MRRSRVPLEFANVLRRAQAGMIRGFRNASFRSVDLSRFAAAGKNTGHAFDSLTIPRADLVRVHLVLRGNLLDRFVASHDFGVEAAIAAAILIVDQVGSHTSPKLVAA